MMTPELLGAIARGEANVTLQVSAHDLRAIVGAICAEERERLDRQAREAAPAELLTVAEVCSMLKIGRTLLRTLEKHGDITGQRFDNSRRVLYRRADVEALLKSRKGA